MDSFVVVFSVQVDLTVPVTCSFLHVHAPFKVVVVIHVLHVLVLLLPPLLLLGPSVDTFSC